MDVGGAFCLGVGREWVSWDSGVGGICRGGKGEGVVVEVKVEMSMLIDIYEERGTVDGSSDVVLLVGGWLVVVGCGESEVVGRGIHSVEDGAWVGLVVDDVIGSEMVASDASEVGDGMEVVEGVVFLGGVGVGVNFSCRNGFGGKRVVLGVVFVCVDLDVVGLGRSVGVVAGEEGGGYFLWVRLNVCVSVVLEVV